MGVERAITIVGGVAALLVSGCCSGPNPLEAVPRGTAFVSAAQKTGSASIVAVLPDGELLALTCRHVIDPDPGALRVLGVHPDLDIALILLPPYSEARPLPLRLDPPGPAEEVYVAGFPFGQCPLISRGIAVGNAVSCTVIPGMSGGPVLDGQGRLVGVIARVFQWNEHPFAAGLFVPIGDLLPWLRDMLAQQGIEVARG